MTERSLAKSLGTEALRDASAQRITVRNCLSLCLLSHVPISQGSTMNFTEWLVIPYMTRRMLFLTLTIFSSGLSGI